jgi:replicative DNA helicase
VLNAIQKGAKVAFYSMEMTKVQLTARLAAMMSGVSSSDLLYSTSLTPDQLARFDSALGALSGYKLYFDDKSTSNIEGILASIRSLKMKYDIDGVVVDYIQILNVNSKNSNKEQAMADAARRLKNIAKDLNIWVIALSQLNRGVESREGIEGKRPQLSDLRESGAIEQDADIVCFIHRPEYYKIFQDERGNDLRGLAEIIIAKHRNGAVGDVRLRFIGNYARFQNIEDESLAPLPEDAVLSSKMNRRNAAPSNDEYIGMPPVPPPSDNPFPMGGVTDMPF